MPRHVSPHSWRHLFRMSVRTLLILVLVLGGGLGWVFRLAHAQRDAAAVIKEASGYVRYDWELKDEKRWWPEWLAKIAGVDFFGHVVHADIASGESNTVLAHVGHLRRLQQLSPSHTAVTDTGLTSLMDLNKLEYLSCEPTTHC
jgi:hypothetical protein